MRFTAEHTFAGVTLDALVALYFDEAFNEALCRNGRLGRELVDARRDGEVLHRAVRIVPERTLPAPAVKLLGAEHFGYVEHMVYDYAARRGTWRIEPMVLANKVRSVGSLTFVATPNGVQRTVSGEVTVKVFGLGGTIERFVVADVERSYAEAAAFTERWLSNAGPSGVGHGHASFGDGREPTGSKPLR